MEHPDEEMALNGSEPVASSSSPSTPAGPSNPASAMSKNAMKRAAKQARAQELKPQRRAAERARRKERQAELREGYKAGTLTEEEKAIYEKRRLLKTQRRNDTGTSVDEWGGAVIIDLGFDELMTDNEITSMAAQVGYVFSANRTSARPFSAILHTSFGPTTSPRLWQKMEKGGWDRWTRSYWWDQGVREVVSALQGAAPVDSSNSGTTDAMTRGEEGGEQAEAGPSDLTKRLTGPTLPPSIGPGRHSVVYLSADADEELTTLSENEVYVIGGIVDRNRYKMLCQDKAVKLGIRTARLPIGKYLENLPTRKVLTVNQVFEILAQYVIQNDWAKAFETVIPQRKYSAVGRQAVKRNLKRQRDSIAGASDDEGHSEGDNPEDTTVDGAVDEEGMLNLAA